jgi:hypothetical protein
MARRFSSRHLFYLIMKKKKNHMAHQTKKCNKCFKALQAEQFHVISNGRRMLHCKECERKLDKLRRDKLKMQDPAHYKELKKIRADRARQKRRSSGEHCGNIDKFKLLNPNYNVVSSIEKVCQYRLTQKDKTINHIQ